jgi:hypothetical protein
LKKYVDDHLDALEQSIGTKMKKTIAHFGSQLKSYAIMWSRLIRPSQNFKLTLLG